MLGKFLLYLQVLEKKLQLFSMKLFSNYYSTVARWQAVALLVSGFLLFSCATYKPQFGRASKNTISENAKDTLKVAHTFYLVGDAGNTNDTKGQATLDLLADRLQTAQSNSTLLFLGDNIYPNGLPSTERVNKRLIAESKLTNQLELSKKIEGKTIFIPGNHDWYSGIKGLERQAKFVTKYTADQTSFLPRNSCGIDTLTINKNLLLVTIDSQWFLEDWNESPTINDNCSIKSREDFFDAFEAILTRNQARTIVLALHHPLMSNGPHGGQFSLQKQLFPLEQKIPLPILGSAINLLRKTTGISPQDLQNKQYAGFIKRMKALLQQQENVIVVSGHEHNLQYIEKDNIKQIISGAGSKSEAAKAVFPSDFSYGYAGYATLTIYENGAAKVAFYGSDNTREKLLYEKLIVAQKDDFSTKLFPNSFPKTIAASVYNSKQTNKNAFYRFLFGKHYRHYYSTPIQAKTAILDTLFGGLEPDGIGGDTQSRSLQLHDKNGKEYVMRALKKSASRFLQSVVFKNQSIEKEFEDTFAENFLLDFYTTAHPYGTLAIAQLADKIGVLHTNPELYYVPKQKALKDFNARFGDELYLVEELPNKSQINAKSFGNPSAIVPTATVLKNIQEDERYSVDESEYIKARLFDMLIGDWNRNEERWQWGEFTNGNTVVYKPIPFYRDQAFTKYDGALLNVLMNMPALRNMQSFSNKIKNVKWFNREAYPLDLALLKKSSKEEWIKQAVLIQNSISDADIEATFRTLPQEVQDKTILEFQKHLKRRKKDLQTYASGYYDVLQKTVLIVGTAKKDRFIIDQNIAKKITVAIYRSKNDGDELVRTAEFSAKKTKNIWIYGLDDADVFEVKGSANDAINIRLIGGQNDDVYEVESGKKVKIHDFKTKNNTFKTDSATRILLSDDYLANLYDFKKPKYNAFSGLPNIGFNPDNGIKTGFIANYTINKFNQNPYTQKHILKANYFFATEGYELLYTAHFPKSVGKWDLDLESQFTSPNFTINYFGSGNETMNNDTFFGMDFNRVRIRILKVLPSIKKAGKYGSTVLIQPSYERITVERTTSRFVDISGTVASSVFDSQQFAGTTLKYSFENYDTPSFPAMGMGFSIAGTWKMNINDPKRNFPTVESKLNFNHKLDANGKIVLASIIKAKMLLNTNFELYQGATLGGDYDLRGFRNERFLGNQSFYHSSDIRWNVGKIRRSVLPMTFGVLAGFDYGRVWKKGEISEKWHQSFGGGLWLNALNVITARITYFQTTNEEYRVAFGLGFGF